MELATLPAIETLIGLTGAPVVLALTHIAAPAIPRLPKGAHALLAVVIGIFWNFAAIGYAHGDLARAPALGALSGLAAIGLRHGIVYRARRH